MKKFKEFLNEDLWHGHPDRVGRSPYIFGENGLEKTTSTSDYQYWLTDSDYERLKVFSGNLSDLFKAMDEEKGLRMKQFKAGVYKVIDINKEATLSEDDIIEIFQGDPDL